jgi:hypothetical protein
VVEGENRKRQKENERADVRYQRSLTSLGNHVLRTCRHMLPGTGTCPPLDLRSSSFGDKRHISSSKTETPSRSTDRLLCPAQHNETDEKKKKDGNKQQEAESPLPVTLFARLTICPHFSLVCDCERGAPLSPNACSLPLISYGPLFLLTASFHLHISYPASL